MDKLRRLCLIAALVMTVALPAACHGTTPTPTPTATLTPTPPAVNPERLLVQSSQLMASLNTFAFRINHQGGGTLLTGGLVMDEATGVVARPDGLKLELTGQMGNAVIKLSLLSQAGATYLTNPFTGKWQKVEATVNPLNFFNPDQGIGGILTSLELPIYLGQEQLQDGVRAYHLRGLLPTHALASLLGTKSGEDATLEADFWLASDSLYLRQVTLQGRLTSTEDASIIRTILLFDFNEPVTISPPI